MPGIGMAGSRKVASNVFLTLRTSVILTVSSISNQQKKKKIPVGMFDPKKKKGERTGDDTKSIRGRREYTSTKPSAIRLVKLYIRDQRERHVTFPERHGCQRLTEMR